MILCWAILLQSSVIALLGWTLYSDRAQRPRESGRMPVVMDRTKSEPTGGGTVAPVPVSTPAAQKVAVGSAATRPTAPAPSAPAVGISYQTVNSAPPQGSSPFVRRSASPVASGSLQGVVATPPAPASAMVANRSNPGSVGVPPSSRASSSIIVPVRPINPASAPVEARANVGQAGAVPREPEAELLDIPLPDEVNSVPVAFEETDPEIRGNRESRERLREIQEEFVEGIGGAGRDTTRPDDGPIWKNAQWLADQKYRAQFGHTAFLAQQERAAAALAKELENQ